MKEQDEKQLWLEIEHIFDSGANELRVFNMVKTFIETRYHALNKGAVISRFSFEEREPEIGAYISLVWEDGSDCECTYNGLDTSILPLPTHWYYV